MKLRTRTPSSKNTDRIYLDYAASTPVAEEVFRAMEPYFNENFGNPGSIHYFGQRTQAAVDKSRELIAEFLGAEFNEIIFTSSATEANNLALRGAIKEFRIQNIESKKLLHSKSYILNPRIIISSIEHESVLETAKDLEREGVEVIYLPVCKEGFVDIKSLKKNLTKNTVLVSIIYASNEIGTIEPIKEIAKAISEFRIQNSEFSKRNNPKSYLPRRQAGILNPIFYPLLHTDAAQAVQFLNCNVQSLGVDLMTISAQKIYGPKGAGALYIKNLEFRNQNLGIKNKNLLNPKSYILNPLITGGGQEFGFRSGTENVPAIVGFAKAIELIEKDKKKEAERIKKLRDDFWRRLKSAKKDIELNGPDVSSAERLPNNLNIYFPGQNSQDLLIKLDMAGIAVSAGSACAARSTTDSYVIRALNLGAERAKSSLRISLGRPTTKGEVDNSLKRIINLFSYE